MENPYQNQSMSGGGYSTNNTNLDRQMAEQRRQAKRREYLEDSEKVKVSFGEIANDFINSKNNQTNWIINQSHKMMIHSYYRKHVDSTFISISILIAMLIAISSFFTIAAAVGAVVLSFIWMMYSKNRFTNKYLKDGDLDKNEKKNICNNIFKNQIKFKSVFILALILSSVNFVVYFYSIRLFINDSFFKNFAIYDFKFSVENELFAYFNIFSILILLMLKFFEKLKS